MESHRSQYYTPSFINVDLEERLIRKVAAAVSEDFNTQFASIQEDIRVEFKSIRQEVGKSKSAEEEEDTETNRD